MSMQRYARSAVIGIALALAALAGCATTDEPVTDDQATVDDTASTEQAAIQLVWACLTPNGTRIGLPKSTKSACQATCAVGNTCYPCWWSGTVLSCPDP